MWKRGNQVDRPENQEIVGDWKRETDGKSDCSRDEEHIGKVKLGKTQWGEERERKSENALVDCALNTNISGTKIYLHWMIPRKVTLSSLHVLINLLLGINLKNSSTFSSIYTGTIL